MWCNSPRMASQNANAIEVLPVPLAPRNNHADEYGASANFARIFLGLSRPTNSESECGLYFSDNPENNIPGMSELVLSLGMLSKRLTIAPFPLSFPLVLRINCECNRRTFERLMRQRLEVWSRHVGP